MTDRVQSLRSRRATLAARGAIGLVVLIACVLPAGCGSSKSSGTHTGSSATTSQTPTSTSTTTSTPTTSTSAPTTTTTEGDVSGKLDTLPEANRETGQLPTVPTTINAGTERTYLTAVFGDAQRFWQRLFSEAGNSYAPARLTLFTNAVHSGCGAQADTGPFYCPANRTIYLDLSFFALLANHAGVGPFGQAYIVGHEFGHHVQHLIGIDQRVALLDQRDPAGTNMRSVSVELQADCLAGVWAHSNQARGQLTENDLRDALKTAAIVGDDFQQQSSGRVVDSSMWTHGSSAQRQQWLMTGFRSGHTGSCDTFSAGPS